MNELPEEIVKVCASPDGMVTPIWMKNLARAILDECEKKIRETRMMIAATEQQRETRMIAEVAALSRRVAILELALSDSPPPAPPAIEPWISIDRETFTDIINAECSCGGNDAQDPKACVACSIYGRFMRWRAARGAKA